MKLYHVTMTETLIKYGIGGEVYANSVEEAWEKAEEKYYEELRSDGMGTVRGVEINGVKPDVEDTHE